MALIADRMIVIGQGRLVVDTTGAEQTRTAEITSITVRRRAEPPRPPVRSSRFAPP